MDADGPLMEEPSSRFFPLRSWRLCVRLEDPGHQPGPLMDADGPLMQEPSSRLFPWRSWRLCVRLEDPRAPTRTAKRGFLAKAPSSQRIGTGVYRCSYHGCYERTSALISCLKPGPLDRVLEALELHRRRRFALRHLEGNDVGLRARHHRSVCESSENAMSADRD